MPRVTWRSGRICAGGTASLSSTARNTRSNKPFISTSANRLPKHSRGPAWKTGYVYASTGPDIASHRSGLNTSASGPQSLAERPMQ